MEVGQLWVKLGLDKSNFDKGVNESKSQSRGLGSFIKGAFQYTVGAGMFDLLKTGIKSAWDASIGFNSSMQQNQISFEVLTKSADKANKMMKDLNKMAADTPFELPQLTGAARTLLAFGFNAEQATKMMKPLGDAASANGERSAEALGAIASIFGQINTAGKLTTQDLKQMTNWGIGAFDILAKQMGKSTEEVQKMVSDGLIPADKGIQMLTKGIEQNFGGMMEKQSKSFSGLMSTLRDNIKSTLAGELKGGFDWLTNKALPAAIKLVEKIPEKIASIKKSAVDTWNQLNQNPVFTFLVGLISNSFQRIWENVKTILSAIAGFWNEHKTLIIGIVSVLFTYVVLIIDSLINGIKNIIQGGLKIIDGIIDFFTNLFKGNFSGAWDAIKQIFSGAIQAIWGLIEVTFVGQIIRKVGGFATSAKELIQGLWNSIRNFFTGGAANAVTTIKELASNIISSFKNINLHEIGRNIIQGLINGIKSIGSNLKDALLGVVNSAVDNVKKKLGINSPSKLFMEFGNYMGEGMAIGITKTENLVNRSANNLAKSAVPSNMRKLGININTQTNNLKNQTTANGPLFNIENINISSEQDMGQVEKFMYQAEFYRQRAAISTGGE